MSRQDAACTSITGRSRGYLIVLSVLLLVGRLDAATIATWDGSTSNWADAPHWSTTPVFPNNNGANTYDAVVNSGAVSVNQAITIDRLSLGGGTLDGPSLLSVLAGLNWTGGTIRGAGALSLGSSSTSTITAPSAPLTFSARTVNNAGTANFTSGTIFGGSGATLNNQAGATFTVLNGANFFANAASPLYTINNAGTFIARSNSGNGFTTVDASFVNTGTLRVENTGSSHTLSLAGGATLGGIVDIAANGTLELGGVTTLQTSTITGSGNAVVAGQVTLAGGISAQNLTVANGELSVGGRTISLAGAAVQNGGTIHLGGGTFRVAAGAGTFVVNDGSLHGTGTINGSLDTFGLIAPGETTGDLNVTGAVSLHSEAHLEIQLGGRAVGQFDRFLMSEGAALEGALDVQLLNGFVPVGSDVFTILISGLGRTGVFSNAPLTGGRLALSQGLGSFQIDYTPTAVVLSGFIIPEPATTILLLAGVLLMSVRRDPK